MTLNLKPGTKAPDFSLKNQDGKIVSLWSPVSVTGHADEVLGVLVI